MNILTQISSRKSATARVVALHCSLGSGRQWAKLGAELGVGTKLIAPDLIGYGHSAVTFDLPLTLAQEVECLRATLDQANGPIHLVGHSYGGAIAFKIATDPAYEHRVQSLTLIEPVLPTLLLDSAPDRRLHDQFADLAAEVREDIWNG
ncbi:alpha/beta fold hydrolase [Bradyrhizobium sp. AUGA SZCCT0182]|uniref:alpha/beta fold hydrolase n=1 Tax=Bradyrhizobium sp. AUGA SZCCT0182 TaxID=2807667 RepID=UPI001BA99019|nr:alpha/beta fold hydrolase [Bradyrhizobium sp. AUGA SZCCT0182]MBR1236927.1 alpha/beta fold hydrolase [Bradyrhizobium sp. AUGA SZCCT0182]